MQMKTNFRIFISAALLCTIFALAISTEPTLAGLPRQTVPTAKPTRTKTPVVVAHSSTPNPIVSTNTIVVSTVTQPAPASAFSQTPSLTITTSMLVTPILAASSTGGPQLSPLAASTSTISPALTVTTATLPNTPVPSNAFTVNPTENQLSTSASTLTQVKTATLSNNPSSNWNFYFIFLIIIVGFLVLVGFLSRRGRTNK
jgi:hypothetical protein